ncbi:DoxX family protein [Nocardioides sp. ChNu-153]|uniref:DoxX family protein n=1 Tax=unclassified Nocardioides TaxID=2615069 RepID=UPI002405062B|nr:MULTISPECIES: DoxX family protein [unclassified Nocardioides]MDF9717771.1 DoxX family protein [Nocardioides sp. ChNu-99]MDN7122591.1 DoxX family protein [Nocardioides sp. ChNu-153]
MTTSAGTPPLTLGAAGLATGFAVSGVVHLVRPETFEPLMPRALPAHTALIKGSGVAELVCAAGLLHPRTRPAAGLASAALLAGVFPGNVTMAWRARRSRNQVYRWGTVARLPLQVPMIRIALRAAGR